MKNIASQLDNIYTPVKALIIFQSPQDNIYVEAHDMDTSGHAINARPLTIEESIQLASMLDCSQEMQRDFLRPKGLLPENLLYLNPSRNGFAIWQTPAKEVNLFFTATLGIPSGKAKVPPLIWKADKHTVEVFALNTHDKPTSDTMLCYAPFFNVYGNGRVCMGSVDIEIPEDCMLEEFMQEWEKYFFNSYFSHTLESHATNTNMVNLWTTLINTGEDFPLHELHSNNKTIQTLCI